MRLTFEHLLGLPAEAALAILHSSGILDVDVENGVMKVHLLEGLLE